MRHLAVKSFAGKLLFIFILAMIILTANAYKRQTQNKESKPAAARPSISIMAPRHLPQLPGEKVMGELEKATGTDLDIHWIANEVYKDKLMTTLATHAFQQVTYVNQEHYVLVKNAIRSGEFWEIGPYLKAYKNLRNLDPGILGETSVNGKIYGLYTERPPSRQGIILREDWLDRLGLDKPRTIGDLYEVMRQFTYHDPDGNGKQDTFGLTDRNDLVYGAFKTLSSYFGTPNNWGLQNGKLVPEFETKAYLETMKFYKKLYDEGLVNRGFAVTSKLVQRNELTNGQAGVYIGSMSDAQRLSDEAKKVNPQAGFTLVNRVLGPTGYHVWAIPSYSGLFLFSKKAIASESKLKQILAFFDRTMDKDVANLMRYGIEGTHYILKDGEVELPERMNQLRVNEVNQLYTLMIADAHNSNIMKVYKQRPLMELSDRLNNDNRGFIVKDPTWRLESRTQDEQGAELMKIIIDATYNFILGHLDEAGFREQIGKWEAEGGGQIIGEYNKAYREQRNFAAQP